MRSSVLSGMTLGGLLLSFNLYAATVHIQVESDQIQTQKIKGFGAYSRVSFSEFKIKNFENSKIVGEPSLPVKSWILVGTPESITVDIEVANQQEIKNLRPYPVQVQPCRCVVDSAPFAYNPQSYPQKYELKYLGAYKGKNLTQLNVNLAHYDADENKVVLDTDIQVSFNADEFKLENEVLKNYLIIAPKDLVAGLSDFVVWKTKLGFNVIIESVLSPNSTLDSVSGIIRKHYEQSQADFVMLIGDEKTIPMYRVKTSSSSSTPSDLKYYLMDGADDKIPDVYASRIVAATVEQVKNKLNKAMEYEQKTYLSPGGLKTIIGIASSEGNNPSDDDYIKGIENQFETFQNFSSVHFAENDPKSNPKNLNHALENGASWLFYIGHGSGTSWPSMYQEYKARDLASIKNKNTVKPIVIDVACQNGRLIDDRFGTAFMSVLGLKEDSAFGAAAYYGGSVDISWDPPALMAKGMAEAQAQNNYNYISQAIFAGQLYLANHWNQPEDVMDNLEWYHLQGDPGMKVSF